MNVKAVIKLEVPNWQIGEKVFLYFPDAMTKEAICEYAEPAEPELHFDGEEYTFNCPNCSAVLYHNGNTTDEKNARNYVKYCRRCGREITWETEKH